MSLEILISDSVLQAIRLPEQRIEQELCQELAVALYTQNFLPLGKARELARMDDKYTFGKLLGDRKIVRHYTSEELEDDVNHANR